MPDHSFDLVNRKWIPVVLPSESATELSLWDVFHRAHEIRDLHTDIPLVYPVTLRLLLAILHRGWQGESRAARYEEWAQWWKHRHFPQKVFDYLEKHRFCFDLFGNERPFFQTAGLTVVGENTGNSIMMLLLNQKNNPTLFDHNLETEPPAFSPAEAVRALLVGQAYLTSGRGGDKHIVVEKAQTKTPENLSQGHLLNAATVSLNGNTLFETLMLNLVPVDADDEDIPVWEKSPAQQFKEATNYSRSFTAGPMERFTFQSRLILLKPETLHDSTIVRRVSIVQGRVFQDSPPDEMKVYFRQTKGEKKDVPFSLDADKSAWRDVHAMLSENESIRPVSFSHAVRVVEKYGDTIPGLSKSSRFRLNVVGLANDQAKILLWRHDRMPATIELLNNADLIGRIQSATKDATFVAEKLYERFKQVAELLDSPNKDQKDGRKPNTDAVSNTIKSFDPRRAYWPRLEAPFYQFLLDLPQDKDSALEHWRDVVESEAQRCFNEARRSLGTSPRALRTAAVPDRFLTSTRLAALKIATQEQRLKEKKDKRKVAPDKLAGQLIEEEVNS